MLIPIFLAALSATLFASVNHIDKYLISKTVKNANYRALILISTIIAGGLMTIIYLFVCGFNLAFDFPSIAILFINSIISTIATVFYFKSLGRDDATIIAILFQLTPVFTLLLQPLFLSDQTMTPMQLLGGGVITLAAIFMTYEPDHKKFSKSKLITLAMMSISSAGFALWFILERYVNQTHDFNLTTFWSNLTLLLVGVLLFFIKSYRRSLLKLFKTNGPKVISLNFINELLNSFAGVVSAFAGTMVSVALVSFMSQGIQPFAVLIMGILITKFFPKIEKENISRKTIIRRIIMSILCLIGLALIQFG